MLEIRAAIAGCSKCGLCLVDCPTYALTGLEPDSPRGRVQALALGVEPSEMSEVDHAGFWGCLSCNACLSVCPTGVDVAGAYRAARVHRPNSTVARVEELAVRRASLVASDPGIAMTIEAVLRRAARGSPTQGWSLPAGAVLVASDLVPAVKLEAVRKLVGAQRVAIAPDVLAGATGLLLDGGLGPLHEEYVAAVRNMCGRAPGDTRLFAVDAEAWRLAPLAEELGVPILPLPALIMELAPNGHLAPGGKFATLAAREVYADAVLRSDRWAGPMRSLLGANLVRSMTYHDEALGPVVLEDAALEAAHHLLRKMLARLDGTTLLTADPRTSARLASSIFYLDHLLAFGSLEESVATH